ncbi:apolipoprotein B-100 isoform X1 [Cyprinodon tularosa]|uniref:apolipoprotein B-100 isoform X1 n=1 Tax=Cyprinodon tularosa TaxID=77115 RepID=UPI0018E2689F|nr:apolipoprotein B-100 isoform X1 [Cyprinodon tularosa]
MAYSPLCLFLLLSSYALAQDVQETASCPMASRFKAQRKYVYRYVADSRNGVVGSAGLQNGLKVTCEVEIQIPQMCRFIMVTRDCSLSEVSTMDGQPEPFYSPAPGSDVFRASMEKSPLRVIVHSNSHVAVYPEEDEPVNILNIKRGIFSAFMVPIMEDGQTSLMSTIHGRCLTAHTLHSSQEVRLSRDLSQCDQFYGRKPASSPVALLQQLQHPVSKLISSSQSCRYLLDSRGTHVGTASCTETHRYLPFSHGENGISSVVKQDLNFQSVKRISSRSFDVEPRQAKPLHFDEPDDKTTIRTKEDILSILQELVALASTDQGQKRTSLFHQLVSSMRSLRNETLSQTVAEMVRVSKWLTFQALFQCGTAECTSAILQVIWTIEGVSLEVDALVYLLGLQANPDAARVRDMLSMAQYRQSKAIMYALANTVKRFYKGGVTPEIKEVSKFMEMILNECSEDNRDSESPSDPQEEAFLVLRVVGVMGRAMQDVSPSLISSILGCMKKTNIPLSNQKAAIQAFRLMEITDEIRRSLLEVYRDPQSSADKRLAAYMVLMKNPDRSVIREITNALRDEKDEQLKSFVISHLHNIHSSDENPEIKELIEASLKDKLTSTNTEFNRLSKNYKLSSQLGSIQSSVIFDGRNTLPKELKLEAALKAFHQSYDLFEVGLEGAGFEPTVEALFGKKGVLPETFSRLIKFAGEGAPMLRELLERISGRQSKNRRQVPEDHLKAIIDHFQKLLHDARFSAAPEATAFLRLLGNEIGYMKMSEMRQMLETLFSYLHVFIHVIPSQAFLKLTSSTENEMFFHYIFMDTSFSLPTASGLPLKFSLSGVLAPGARGGLTASAETDVSFKPSVGLELITQMGVHLPDFVETGTEMHSSLYHESSFNARVSVKKNQMKLSIPAPTSSSQLLSIRNQLLSVSSGQTKPLPSLVENQVDSTDCQPLITGLNLCTVVRYSNASSVEQAPYFPLTGEALFAVELQPTGKVSKFVATISDETVREGKRGRTKVETLKLSLRTEGEEPMEAAASVKYNHHKNSISSELLIPDWDLEAGVSLDVTRSDGDRRKMRGFTINVTNKNIPQLTLVGRARHEMMKEIMLQLQMDIPSLKMDASVTTTLRKDENVLVDFESALQLPDASYLQKASLKYDDHKFQVELNTDLNAEIKKMIPNGEEHQRNLQKLIDEILDQKVAKTDMKLRHIVTKGIQAGNNWLNKLTAHFPLLTNLRSKRSISDLHLPPLPEKIFLKSDTLLQYKFNKEKITFNVPLPFGGKKSEELNLPKTLSVPVIDLPQIGIYIPAQRYSLPTISFPRSLDLTIPLLGLAEASTKIHSNLYNWEGSIVGGNDTADIPNYVARYQAVAQSPISLLSYKFEGAGMISGRAEDNLKYLLNCSFSHIFLDTSVSILETVRVTERLNAQANYQLKASSPLGLHASLDYSAQSTSTLNSDEVLGDGTLDGILKLASFHVNMSYSHSYNLRPRDREGRGKSTLRFDSPFSHFQNTIQGVYANSELNVISKTSSQSDVFKHVAELRYKDAQLTLKCNGVLLALEKSVKNVFELGVSSQKSILRIESQVDDDTSRVYSLITGSLGSNGLVLNSEGSLIFAMGRGLHKATVRAERNGLTFSGMNSIQCSPVTMENTFDGAVDFNGASCSSFTKMMAEEGRGELSIKGKVTPSEASLHGDFKGRVYDAATTNNMDLKLNRKGLTIRGNTKGTLRQMMTENSHELIVTLWTLSLHSKTENFICEDLYYRQNTKFKAKPFLVSLDFTNNLRFYDLMLNKESHVKLDLLELDLRGTLNGAFREQHNISHTYELTYKDLSGSVKSSTLADIMDTQLGHGCSLHFAGFSSLLKCEAKLNSEPLRFGGNIQIQALPFSLDIDSSVESEGEINLHGRHRGQIFSSLVVKTAPLALAWSHDCLVSTTHRLPNGESSMSFNNKFEGLLTPRDQALDWKVNSKLNSNAYEQSITAYNNPDKVGLELSGVALTDFLRHKRSKPEAQTFSIAGFLKYDKNSDCHTIEIPVIESFPSAFDHIKRTFAAALESLQQFLQNLNINQLIGNFRANLDQLPVQVKNFMKKIDLDNQVVEIKRRLDYLMNEFSVSMDDLELGLSNLKRILEENILHIATEVHNLISAADEFITAGHLTHNITTILSYIRDQLQAFDAKYNIKQSLLRTLDFTEDIIRQTDLRKLKQSSVAFLHELDLQYGILETIKEKLSELKTTIEDFDLVQVLENVKTYLLSIDWAYYVEQFSYQIPMSEIAKVMESMNEVILNWIDEYEIPNKLNAVLAYFKYLLLKYELDDIFKDFIDQAVILVKEWKLEETLQKIVEALKTIKIEIVYGKIMDFLYILLNKVREADFQTIIDDLNGRISSILESMKGFDYSAFVDQTNREIADLTAYLNKEIERYEIVNKIEAVRQFFREIQHSIYTYLDELKNTKVSEVLKKLKDVMDSTFYNDVKLKVQDILEDMRQRILDMDIRDEIHIYFQRVSDSYKNTVTFISVHFDRLIEWIKTLAGDIKVIEQTKQAVEEVLVQLKRAEIEIPTFTIPLTDLVIPEFTINLNRMQEITIPAQIAVPEFTVLASYTIPAFKIDFKEIKTRIVAVIDRIRGFQIKMPDLEDIFGNLKVIYLPDLPDLTFPEIVLIDIRFPAISIPKFNLQDSGMRKLTVPDVVLPEIPTDICIPVFGKLYGELSITAPQYILVNKLKIENSTSDSSKPKFVATCTSHAKSPIKALEHTLETMAVLEAPGMEKLHFKQTFKATHMAFSVDHEVSLMLPGSPAEISANATTLVTSEFYTAELVGNAAFSLESEISAVIESSFNHKLDFPALDASSQVSLKQNIVARVESGLVTVTGESTGYGEWSIQGLSDEGTHRTNGEFQVDMSTAKLTCRGEIDYNALRWKHMLTAESAILSHIAFEAQSESRTPFVKNSVLVLKGEANVADLKAALTFSHEAEFIGDLAGTMSNSLELKAHPFEITVDVRNKINPKVLLPLKLTSKMDFHHDYGVTMNSEKQRAWWLALVRFNQYKYSHNFTAENNEKHIFFQSVAEGEANLEFLTIPLSVPEMTVPYLQIHTPELRDLSLWEDVGFKFLLFNPQQSFDMDLRFQYHKNPALHCFELHLEPIYSAINSNFEIIQGQFEGYRDKMVKFLKYSYNEARTHYLTHKINTSRLPPRIFRVPGYRIPLLGIQVSAFRAEMPAFSYFVPKKVSTPSFRVPALGFSVPSYTLVLPSLRFPVIYVPETLSEVKLPSFTLPAVQDSIGIPAMGNMTFDFSLKSSVISLNANAGLNNESDIVARFRAFSVSPFDALKGKLDGTTSLTRTRGLKLASAISLEHSNVQADHECSVSLTRRSMEASAANSIKVNLPFLQIEMNQELSGGTRTKINVLSKKKLSYMFNVPQVAFAGKGSVDTTWDLKAQSSHVLVDYSTKGRSDMMIMDLFNLASNLENTKSFYLSINGLRTTGQTSLSFTVDKQVKQKRSLRTKLFLFNLENMVASDVSLHRVYATVQYKSYNNFQTEPFTMVGTHAAGGELDLAPLKSFSANLGCDVNQSSSLGDAVLSQDVTLAFSSEKQSFSWSLKEQLGSVLHGSDWNIFNEVSEAGSVFSVWVGGPLAFLKLIKLPVYQRSLWDVLKFDEVTNINDVQLFNFSSAVTYTKSMDGFDYQIPSTMNEDGVTFSLPVLSFAVPLWAKEAPLSSTNTGMKFEMVEVPDNVTIPPIITVPAFHVPLTSSNIESFTVDPKSLTIPKVIPKQAFDILFPGLPVISVPSYDIRTEYLKDKMSFLSLRIPQHEITVSSFTVPKSLTIGELTIHLDDITNHISSFKIPALSIPEQKVEIPELVLNLPSSIFIPSFGSLSALFNISSPIYKVSTVASVSKKDLNLEGLISSLCTSTLVFMEYDLTASATIRYIDKMFQLNGDGRLAHRDAAVNWHHVLDHPLRIKRQISRGDSVSRDYRHTLDVDITSPTFTDVSIRFASHRDSITASASSPSAGFLGLHLQRRSSSLLHGRLFSRFLDSPAKDINLLTAKASLRNSDKLVLQTSWNWDSINDLITGFKDRIPLMTNSLLKFINKYHVSHFGFDLNRASVKLRAALLNAVDGVRHVASASLTALQDALQTLADLGLHWYHAASDTLRFPDSMDLRNQWIGEVTGDFLNNRNFSVPGSDRKFSISEMFQQGKSSIMEMIADHTFTIPGTEVVVNGSEIMWNLKREAVAARYHAMRWLRRTSTDIKHAVRLKVQEAHSALSMEPVNSAAQGLITVLQSNLTEAVQRSVDVMEKVTQSAAPYIRVRKEQVDVEIPFPWMSVSG